MTSASNPIRRLRNLACHRRGEKVPCDHMSVLIPNNDCLGSCEKLEYWSMLRAAYWHFLQLRKELKCFGLLGSLPYLLL